MPFEGYSLLNRDDKVELRVHSVSGLLYGQDEAFVEDAVLIVLGYTGEEEL
jgi:hypothetical protein